MRSKKVHKVWIINLVSFELFNESFYASIFCNLYFNYFTKFFSFVI